MVLFPTIGAIRRRPARLAPSAQVTSRRTSAVRARSAALAFGGSLGFFGMSMTSARMRDFSGKSRSHLLHSRADSSGADRADHLFEFGGDAATQRAVAPRRRAVSSRRRRTFAVVGRHRAAGVLAVRPGRLPRRRLWPAAAAVPSRHSPGGRRTRAGDHAGRARSRKGTFTLNKAAYLALGQPEAVQLLYDRDERVIGFRRRPSPTRFDRPSPPGHTPSLASPSSSTTASTAPPLDAGLPASKMACFASTWMIRRWRWSAEIPERHSRP